MDLDTFTSLALEYSGVSSENIPDYLKKIDRIEDKIKKETSVKKLTSTKKVLSEILNWFWTKNPNRFAVNEEKGTHVFDYTRLDKIIDRDLLKDNNNPVGVCAGLLIEYAIISERFGLEITPMNFRALETAHIFGVYKENGQDLFIDVTLKRGIGLNLSKEARSRIQELTKEQLLSVLIKNKAAELSRRGDEYGSIAALNFALTLNPESAEIYYNLGLNYSLIGQNKKAIENYEKAIKIFPKHSLAQYNLGNIYAKQGKYGDAERWFKESIKSFGGFSPAYGNLGACLILQGKKTEAIPYLTKALELDPTNAEAENNLRIALH